MALQWMIEQARDLYALRIDDARYRRYVLGEGRGEYQPPSATAAQHESLRGPWWIAEFLPLRERTWIDGVEHRKLRLRRPACRREIKPGSTLHQSVIERLEAGEYRPPNLPADYSVEP